MAVDPTSPWYGWDHIQDRSKAMQQVTVQGGSATSSSSDQPGVGWVAGVADYYSGPWRGEVAMTVGQAGYAPGRALKVVCTVAGNITVLYPDGSQGTWPVVVGTQVLSLAVTEIVSETATSTFFNLK